MIDFSNLTAYRENNRIEAKKALGGLPRSIWETYSAFTNTNGGIILLGVEESKDKSLHPVDLPDPDKLIKAFWDIINNPNKVSVNILTDKDVSVQDVAGNRIISIRVPRADRYDKPVYLDDNPMTGSGQYRRARWERNPEHLFRLGKAGLEAAGIVGELCSGQDHFIACN